jgi:predicted Na+-dependent transporter
MTSPLLPWLTTCIAAAVFTVMLSLGLMVGREQVAAARARRMVLAVALFAVVVPAPAVAVLLVKLAGLKGVVAAGILLMAISPGAPIALRRAIEAGGSREFAPALHLAIVVLAIFSVPAGVAILSRLFGVSFAISPLDVARQVFFAQLLPLALGAAVRAWRPDRAARLEALLAQLTGWLLLGLSLALLIVLWPLMQEVGWIPFAAGIGLTLCALGIGGAIVARDAQARPAVAVAAAMRNPGLALLIAAVNKMPAGVVAAVFGYALGLALVVAVFVAWQGRRRRQIMVPP